MLEPKIGTPVYVVVRDTHREPWELSNLRHRSKAAAIADAQTVSGSVVYKVAVAKVFDVRFPDGAVSVTTVWDGRNNYD